MKDLVEDILALTALFAMGYAILLWGTIGAALAGRNLFPASKSTYPLNSAPAP